MYIIADVEWVENQLHKSSPTQLAAVRVNEDWEIIEEFFTYIRPMNSSFHNWGHMAYSGGTPKDFKQAPSCHEAFSSFNAWVGEDVICWWAKRSASIHALINRIVLKTQEPKPPLFLNDYTFNFLRGEEYRFQNAYAIARARGIWVPKTEHNARNDVTAILCLFTAIGFPQRLLLESLPFRENIERYEYLYDRKAALLHKKGCPYLPEDGDIQGFDTLKTPIRQRYRACDCVREELRAAKRERIIDEINRTQYTFIYAENSTVFHRYDCGLLYNAERILGAVKYDTIIKKGLRPCQVCNPSVEDQYRPAVYAEKLKTMTEPKAAQHGLTRLARAAVARLEEAQSERFSKDRSQSMSEQERKDFLILTQPGFAFFAASGYKNFHTRKCSRLKGTSDIRGFDTFAHAMNAGYTPCKVCKPSKKMDILKSIPINNKIRAEESVEDLQRLCDKYGYAHEFQKGIFKVTTPVGKWRIHTDTRPVTVEHLKLSKEHQSRAYHVQHRIFLSMLDVLVYIHRHDTISEGEDPT